MAISKSASPVVGLAALMVVIHLVNFATGYSLNSFGILPRSAIGLVGIPASPFLHASFTHLISNLTPFLILGWIVSARSHGHFMAVSAIVIVAGGFLVWIFGRSSYHVGASGWIFGMWAYLIARGWFERSLSSLLISTAVVIVYGGMLFGFMPSRYVSFEAHIAGAVAGVLAAMLIHPRNTKS